MYMYVYAYTLNVILGISAEVLPFGKPICKWENYPLQIAYLQEWVILSSRLVFRIFLGISSY